MNKDGHRLDRLRRHSQECESWANGALARLLSDQYIHERNLTSARTRRRCAHYLVTTQSLQPEDITKLNLMADSNWISSPKAFASYAIYTLTDVYFPASDSIRVAYDLNNMV